MRKPKGLIFVLSGPSGSGKTTLHERLLKDKEVKLKRSVSCTTRAKRAGEKQGRDYCFISRREFFIKKRRQEFLETQKVFGQLYGTPSSFVRKSICRGQDVLLCIDVKGAMVVKKKFPEAVMIFIAPPSFKTLSQRLDQRSTENHSSKGLRIKIAKRELGFKKHYDHIVKNDKLNQALKELKNIIRNTQRASKH